MPGRRQLLSSALVEGLLATAEPDGEDAIRVVPASEVDAVRAAGEPNVVLRLAIVADDGLMTLQDARHAVQDDPWVDLAFVRIALPDGFDAATATRALLDELAFTVPTYVELPRTGFEGALDVLAEDGAERATYRCDPNAPGGAPTDGEIAAFVHGCASRRLGFGLAGVSLRAVRSPANASAGTHGVLNLLAATTASVDGAATTEVAELLATGMVETLVESCTRAAAADVRAALTVVDGTGVGRALGELQKLDVFTAD